MVREGLDAELRAVIDGIRIIDTHEHLEEEERRLAAPLDFSRLFSPHAESDLVSAGMAPRDAARFLVSDTELDEKWRLVAPYWPLVRHAGFGQVIRRTARDLYGIEEIAAETYGPLTEAMRQANRAGVHGTVLGERAGIDACIVHNLDGPGVLYRESSDSTLYHQDLAIQHLMADTLPLDEFARQTGSPVGSLRELLRIIDGYFSRYGDRVVAISNNCAGWRTLRFDDVTQGQAESLFDRGYVDQERLSSSEAKVLQDFLFHYCIRGAIDYRLPIKIHTGYMAGNNRVDISRIRATDMVPLFRKYPQARFVLLHMGYPYQHEVLALAKQFNNVYVDLSGSWALDRDAVHSFVRQWIATTPINKLFAFGGNAFFADLAYGQAQIARESLCRVLSELMDEGYLARAEAEEMARRFLRENAWAAFRLEDKSRVSRPAA